MQGVDAVGQDVVASSSKSLTDREVMELILFGTPEDLRAASPLMNERAETIGSEIDQSGEIAGHDYR